MAKRRPPEYAITLNLHQLQLLAVMAGTFEEAIVWARGTEDEETSRIVRLAREIGTAVSRLLPIAEMDAKQSTQADMAKMLKASSNAAQETLDIAGLQRLIDTGKYLDIATPAKSAYHVSVLLARLREAELRASARQE